MPNPGVDPIVLGAAVVSRLQSIVAREVAPKETAVVTVSSFHAGTKSNIVPDSAVASATQGRPTVYAGAVGRGHAPHDLQKNARHCRAFPLR